MTHFAGECPSGLSIAGARGCDWVRTPTPRQSEHTVNLVYYPPARALAPSVPGLREQHRPPSVATLGSRYKIVVQVTIGHMKDQGVRVASRCLWDTHTDNYASVHFKNQSMWCSAMVFGLYTD